MPPKITILTKHDEFSLSDYTVGVSDGITINPSGERLRTDRLLISPAGQGHFFDRPAARIEHYKAIVGTFFRESIRDGEIPGGHRVRKLKDGQAIPISTDNHFSRL